MAAPGSFGDSLHSEQLHTLILGMIKNIADSMSLTDQTTRGGKGIGQWPSVIKMEIAKY